MLVLGACTGGDDSPSDGSGTSASGSGATKGTAAPAGTAPTMKELIGDNPVKPVIGPAWNQSLPEDVTADQIKAQVDKGAMPIAPAHGGGFETMTNSVFARKQVDVMLFGDSMVQQGVDPQALAEALDAEYSDSLGREVTVFNGASSRARWGINRMLVRALEKQHRLPRVALLGITTRGMEGDDWYTSDVQRTPFSSYFEGCDRPDATGWTSKDAESCERDVSDLQYRFRKGGGQYRYAAEGNPLQRALILGDADYLRDDGFMIHPGVTKAQADSISRKRIKRGFPGWPHNEDEATQQWGDVVSLLREHGVTVISFEVPYSPVHQRNLENSWPGYDAKRQTAAANLAASAQVTHYPVRRFGPWWGDGDSRDAIHLAPQGAASFARQLAKTPGFLASVGEGLDTAPTY